MTSLLLWLLTAYLLIGLYIGVTAYGRDVREMLVTLLNLALAALLWLPIALWEHALSPVPCRLTWWLFVVPVHKRKYRGSYFVTGSTRKGGRVWLYSPTGKKAELSQAEKARVERLPWGPWDRPEVQALLREISLHHSLL